MSETTTTTNATETATTETAPAVSSGAAPAAAVSDFAERQLALRAQIATVYRGQIYATLTKAYVMVGALCWRYLDNSIRSAGTAAGKEHGKRWTSGVKELEDYLREQLGEDSPNISRMVGFYALARLIGEESVNALPFSHVRCLLPLIERDDTAPGLEWIDPKSADKVIAYRLVEEWKVSTEGLLVELAKGAAAAAKAAAGKGKAGKGILTYRELSARVEQIRGGKARGRGGKEALTGKDANKKKVPAKESGPIPDAVRRLGAVLSGKTVKDVADGRRLVVKKAVAERVITASDLSSAVLAIADDERRPLLERLSDLRLIRSTLVDCADSLKLELAAERKAGGDGGPAVDPNAAAKAGAARRKAAAAAE